MYKVKSKGAPANNTMQSLLTHKQLKDHYNTLRQESHRYGERNDCTVIATAMLFSLSYNDAHKLLYDLGRKAHKGFNVDYIVSYYKHRCSNPQYIRQPNGSLYTVRSIPETLPVGKFMLLTVDHALACINGAIYDWSANRKHRILKVIEIDTIFDLL